MVMIRSFPAIDEHLDTLATQLPVRPSLFACDEFLNRTRNSGAWDRVLARPQRGPTAMRADRDEGRPRRGPMDNSGSLGPPFRRQLRSPAECGECPPCGLANGLPLALIPQRVVSP